MDMYLYCLISSSYDLFVKTIIDYLKEQLGENVDYQSDYIDGIDYVGCSLFCMYIESPYKNVECDLQFTKDEYDIETDVSVFINLYTATIKPGIDVIGGLVGNIENKLKNIIVQDHASKAVYLKSLDKKYIDHFFWDNMRDV